MHFERHAVEDKTRTYGNYEKILTSSTSFIFENMVLKMRAYGTRIVDVVWSWKANII